jgi:hypothetical protein
LRRPARRARRGDRGGRRWVVADEAEGVDVAEAVGRPAGAEVEAEVVAGRRDGSEPCSAVDGRAAVDGDGGEWHVGGAPWAAFDRDEPAAGADPARHDDPAAAGGADGRAWHGFEVGASVVATGEGVGPEIEGSCDSAWDRCSPAFTRGCGGRESRNRGGRPDEALKEESPAVAHAATLRPAGARIAGFCSYFAKLSQSCDKG